MAWCRIQLTEDERRIVNEERTSHPSLLVRNKMLTISVVPSSGFSHQGS